LYVVVPELKARGITKFTYFSHVDVGDVEPGRRDNSVVQEVIFLMFSIEYLILFFIFSLVMDLSMLLLLLVFLLSDRLTPQNIFLIIQSTKQKQNKLSSRYSIPCLFSHHFR